MKNGKSVVYKLTDQDGWTRKGSHNACKWGPGVTHTAKGMGGLCSSGVIHAYLSPELAVFLNPIGANIENPRLWIAETIITHKDNGLKVGGKSLTTIKEIPLPFFTDRQKAIFAVLCADTILRICGKQLKSNRRCWLEEINNWHVWKQDFLTNKDTVEAAWATAEAAKAAWAARAAWAAEAAVAALAVEAAAWAAEAAVAALAVEAAARAARAAWAARTAARAAEAAAWAAAKAAKAAAWAVAGSEFDLIEIAKQVLEYK